MAVNSFREDEYMENTDKKKILSRLLSYLLDYKLAIAGVLVCMGITVGISLVNPLLIEEAIDHYIAQSDFKGLIALGIFALALNVLFIILVKVRMYSICLLYTSDAADEEDSGDLGGRRTIKKKKKEEVKGVCVR